MKMINAVIIDDEKHCTESLQILLKKYCPEVYVIDTCSNGESGINSIIKHKPDLIFLDIAMPKMSGFDMLSKLNKIDFEIVFTTAFDNYAIKAFKVSAADYLLKPVDRKELINATELVSNRIHLKKLSKSTSSKLNRLTMLLENLQHSKDAFPNIAVPTMDGLEIVKAEEIIYIIGDSNYVHIHIKDKKSLMISKTIKYMEERLTGHNFFRIHNSYFVNINEVIKYNKGSGGSVIMSDGKQLSVSKTRKNELMKLFK